MYGYVLISVRMVPCVEEYRIPKLTGAKRTDSAMMMQHRQPYPRYHVPNSVLKLAWSQHVTGHLKKKESYPIYDVVAVQKMIRQLPIDCGPCKRVC